MMVIARMVALWLVLLTAPASAATNGMSIDCATSKEPFAPTICGSRYLSALDRQMTAAYSELTRQLTGTALADLKSSQAQWWKDRQTCYPEEDIAVCAERHLTDQIAMLQEFKDQPTYDLLPPVSESDYKTHLYDFDLFIVGKDLGRFDHMPSENIREKIRAFMNSQSDEKLIIEGFIRGVELRVVDKEYDSAISIMKQFENSARYPNMTESQRARFLLLRALAQKRKDTLFWLWTVYWTDYCRIMPTCDERVLDDDSYVLDIVLQLGLPAPSRRKALAGTRLARVKDDAQVLKARILQEEAAFRAAEEQERRRIEAAAERERQRQRDQILAAARAADAAKRAAQEEEARLLHRTFGYQARLLGGAFVGGLKFIWALVPLWVYGVAAALAWLVHRHLALRITFGIAAFAVIAYGAVYAGPAGAFLPGGPGPLLAAVWQAWTAYNPDIERVRLAGNIVFTYVPVAVIAYCLTLALIGRDVRAAEAYRLRGFLPGWLRSWRYGFAQWRAERAERRRLLRDAKFQARLAAIQAAGVPGNYAMAGPGGVPVVRLQRTLGDHIRVFGSVMGVLFGAGTLLFSWYVWYTDSASSWLAWIGQALWKSMKQEAGW